MPEYPLAMPHAGWSKSLTSYCLLDGKKSPVKPSESLAVKGPLGFYFFFNVHFHKTSGLFKTWKHKYKNAKPNTSSTPLGYWWAVLMLLSIIEIIIKSNKNILLTDMVDFKVLTKNCLCSEYMLGMTLCYY